MMSILSGKKSDSIPPKSPELGLLIGILVVVHMAWKMATCLELRTYFSWRMIYIHGVYGQKRLRLQHGVQHML